MNTHYGLIFDVDGVIADTEAVNARASIKVFEDLFGVHGVKREDFDAGIGRGAEAYVKAAARVHGIELTHEQVEEATRTRQENFLKLLEEHPLPCFPGVMELVRAGLARDDFRLAIATSSTLEKSESVLRSARIPYHEMTYMTGSDVTKKKPDPQLFLLAVQRMDLRPENCLVVEDALVGVQAARAAGCKCLAVTNTTSGRNLATADRVVDSLGNVTIEDVIDLINAA